MMTLEGRYAGDPRLFGLYARKLPIPGWAGATDDREREYRRRYRAEQDRKPRGKPFGPGNPSPSQRPARLVRDVDEVNDSDVAVAAAR